MTPILKVSNLDKSFNVPILKNVNFEINKGEKVALVGLNGVGKSTLVNIINKIIPQDNGEIQVDNNEISTCFTTNELPDYISITELIRFRKWDKKKLSELLNYFNAQKYEHTLIKNLSSGTQKKMNLIYTLLNPVQLIILDEPTTVLDFETTANLSEYIKNDSRTYLVISHDFGFLNYFTTKYLVLSEQTITKTIENKEKEQLKNSDLIEIFKKLKEQNNEDTSI